MEVEGRRQAEGQLRAVQGQLMAEQAARERAEQRAPAAASAPATPAITHLQLATRLAVLHLVGSTRGGNTALKEAEKEAKRLFQEAGLELPAEAADLARWMVRPE